jgi:hypothetical protein
MHMQIVVNCVTDPTKWSQIPLPLSKNLSIGTGFERALDHAGRELTKAANSEQDVTFWIRGSVLVVAESGGLKILPQGPTSDFELMARIEGVLEKCFIAHQNTGESEWVECKKKEGNA